MGTPIGNLEDISLRALHVLSEVDVIFCEDTRVTGKLIKSRFDLSNRGSSIPTKSESGHYKLKIFNAHSRMPDLSVYENIAYVTDAGTPGLSDPGARLVELARREGINVAVVPGPSALTSLISISGQETKEFTFLGFLPHKKGRETLLKEIALSKRPVVVYESSHRIIKLLEKLASLCPEKKVIIGRELTKKFEEVLEGTSASLLALLQSSPLKQKGEFTVLVTR